MKPSAAALRAASMISSRVAPLPAQRDVVGDALVEQDGFLRDERDVVAQRLQRDMRDVLAVDGDAAGVAIVEAQEDIEDRALAGAGGTDQRDLLPGGNVDGDILEGRRVGMIGEADIVEADRRSGDGERLRVGRVHDLRVLVDDGEDAVGRSNALGKDCPELTQHAHGLLREQHGRDERHELVDRQLIVKRLVAREREGQRNGNAADEIGRGNSRRARAHCAQDVAKARLDADVRVVDGVVLEIVGLDDATAGQRFAQGARQAARLFHAPL